MLHTDVVWYNQYVIKKKKNKEKKNEFGTEKSEKKGLDYETAKKKWFILCLVRSHGSLARTL